MSMAEPFLPVDPQPDGGIPAADPGAGAPPPAEGFGVGGEEPDRPEETSAVGPEVHPGPNVFRTPDPSDVHRGD